MAKADPDPMAGQAIGTMKCINPRGRCAAEVALKVDRGGRVYARCDGGISDQKCSFEVKFDQIDSRHYKRLYQEGKDDAADIREGGKAGSDEYGSDGGDGADGGDGGRVKWGRFFRE